MIEKDALCARLCLSGHWNEKALRIDIENGGVMLAKPVNLFEFAEAAYGKLETSTFDFYAGGAEDEVTLRRDRAAFENILLRPRYLRDVSTRNLATEILGQPISLPVLLAPTSYHGLAHPEGELASARAAARCGTIMVASMMASYTLEEIAGAASGPLWFQLNCYSDRRITEWLVRRAEDVGYCAFCLTIDTPVLGRHERSLRNGFDLRSLGVRNVSVATAMKLPAGLTATEILAYDSAQFDTRLTWEIIDWLHTITSLPIVIKGILTPEDARLAIEHGATAIIVSNHGGRQLDGVPASIEVLPEIVADVGNQVAVLLDGGIRRGTDILKALALGAQAVLIGRPVLWGLAADGENGVRDVLEMLREEFDTALALIGVCSVQEIDARVVYPQRH